MPPEVNSSLPAALDPATLARVRLVLMDIDGTLVAGSELELENVSRHLSKLASRGVRFSVATGRTIFGARTVVKTLGTYGRAPLIIAYNGAVIANLDASPWIHRRTIGRSHFLALLKTCRELDLFPLVYTCVDKFDVKGDQESVFAEPHLLATAKTEFNGMPITRIPDLARLPAEAPVAVLISDPCASGPVEALAERLRRECGPALRVTSSGGGYVEVAHAEATKRRAMADLCTRLGVSTDEVMAIGDNFNDLEMLAGCGVGVAVANSPPAVKRACHFVCQQSAARGVVEVLMTVAKAYRYQTRRRKVQQEAE